LLKIEKKEDKNTVGNGACTGRDIENVRRLLKAIENVIGRV
jgi:hypothetical protein